MYPDQYDETGFGRPFKYTGRLGGLGNVRSHYFDVHVLPVDFPKFAYSRSVSQTICPRPKASNVSAVWLAGHGSSCPIVEILLNGVKQGFKQLDARKAKQSALCRTQMCNKGRELAQLLINTTPFSDRSTVLSELLRSQTYAEAKNASNHSTRMSLKVQIGEWLGGWIQNSEDDAWRLSEVEDMVKGQDSSSVGS